MYADRSITVVSRWINLIAIQCPLEACHLHFNNYNAYGWYLIHQTEIFLYHLRIDGEVVQYIEMDM